MCKNNKVQRDWVWCKRKRKSKGSEYMVLDKGVPIIIFCIKYAIKHTTRIFRVVDSRKFYSLCERLSYVYYTYYIQLTILFF